MNRLALFKSALERSQAHVKMWGEHIAITSIIAQLEYLIGLETGHVQDRSRLANINIGVLTVREIEERDVDLANTLWSVSEEAKRMLGRR